jgi:hypothetical protein
MNPTKTMMCSRCHALRWVEDWKEDRDEMMSIVLGPCGHLVARPARLEWAVFRLGQTRPEPARFATS